MGWVTLPKSSQALGARRAHTGQVWLGRAVRMGALLSLCTQKIKSRYRKICVREQLLTPPAPKLLQRCNSAQGLAGLAQVGIGSLFITEANGGEQMSLTGVLGTNLLSSSQPGLIRTVLGTSFSLPERKAVC